MSLLDDLRAGQAAARRERPCQLCEFIASIEDPETKSALIDSTAGSIGVATLVSILSRHNVEGSPIGRRTIERHRTERHGA